MYVICNVPDKLDFDTTLVTGAGEALTVESEAPVVDPDAEPDGSGGWGWILGDEMHQPMWGSLWPKGDVTVPKGIGVHSWGGKGISRGRGINGAEACPAQR